LRKALSSRPRLILVFHHASVGPVTRIWVCISVSGDLVAFGLQHPLKVLERVAIACMTSLSILKILKIAKRASGMMPRNLSILLSQRRSNFISYQVLNLGSKVMRVRVLLGLVVLLRSDLRLAQLSFVSKSLRALVPEVII
jgi:hypothetical protein